MVGKKSFTLVELSITLCVIALLIGALMGGRKMVERAKIQATIAEIQEYQSAFAKFYDTYGYMPGDMPDAQAKLAPAAYTTATLATIKTLDEKILKTIPLNGKGIGELSGCVIPTAAPYYSDFSLAWSHLSAAGFIEEKYSSLCKSLTSDQSDACFEAGYNIPKAKYGYNGMYIFSTLTKFHSEYQLGLLEGQKATQHTALLIVNLKNTYNQIFKNGNVELNYERTCRQISGTTYRFGFSNGGITAPLLAEIDIKIDDGFPLTGNVAAQNPAAGRASYAVSTTHQCVKIATAQYGTNAGKINGTINATILNNPSSLAALNMYNGTDDKALCIGVFAMPQF